MISSVPIGCILPQESFIDWEDNTIVSCSIPTSSGSFEFPQNSTCKLNSSNLAHVSFELSLHVSKIRQM